MIAVWDFCRAVDDTVDEQPASPANPEGRGRCTSLARRVARRARPLLCRPRRQRRRGSRLQPWLTRFSLSRQPFADLIDGVEMDLDRCRYPHLRGPVRILLAGCVHGRSHLPRDLRRARRARLRRQSRRRAAADEHPARRRGRLRARSRLSAARRPRALRRPRIGSRRRQDDRWRPRAADIRGGPRPGVLPPGSRGHAGATTAGRWWRRRSWRRSTARCCSRSSGPDTTCCHDGCGSRGDVR